MDVMEKEKGLFSFGSNDKSAVFDFNDETRNDIISRIGSMLADLGTTDLF